MENELDLALNFKSVCNNPKVCKIKNQILEEVFDILNSFEYNTEECNLECWKGLSKEINELCESVKSANNDNSIREILKLKLLTEKRNKLNRKIATLKKANLEPNVKCSECGEEAYTTPKDYPFTCKKCGKCYGKQSKIANNGGANNENKISNA